MCTTAILLPVKRAESIAFQTSQLEQTLHFDLVSMTCASRGVLRFTARVIRQTVKRVARQKERTLLLSRHIGVDIKLIKAGIIFAESCREFTESAPKEIEVLHPLLRLNEGTSCQGVPANLRHPLL